jgi:hypothetical protein
MAKEHFAEAGAKLAPLFEAYAFGQRMAKENRLLPADCQAAYDSMTGPDASTAVDTLEANGFKNGCLETAKKQSKRITKENEKRAREAAKQAKEQSQ